MSAFDPKRTLMRFLIIVLECVWKLEKKEIPLYLISVMVASPPGTSTVSPTFPPSTARESGET